MTLHDGWVAVQSHTHAHRQTADNNTTKANILQSTNKVIPQVLLLFLTACRQGRNHPNAHRMDNKAISGCEHHLPTLTVPQTTKSSFEQINASTRSVDADACGRKLPHAAALSP